MRLALALMLPLVVLPWAATAQPAPSGSARPARGPQSETTLPTGAPPATTTQTTGQHTQDPVVRGMNQREGRKVEQQGK